MTDTEWQNVLRPGEEILWQGKPRQDLRLKPTRKDILAGLWGIGALVFSVPLLWLGGAFAINRPVGVLMALPLVAILGLSIYHAFLKHRRLSGLSRRAQYALSNQRALVRLKAQGGRLFALELRGDTEVALNAPPCACGTGPRRVTRNRCLRRYTSLSSPTDKRPIPRHVKSCRRSHEHAV